MLKLHITKSYAAKRACVLWATPLSRRGVTVAGGSQSGSETLKSKVYSLV